MTDTTILDGMMEALKRNPLTDARLGKLGPNQVGQGKPYGVALQSVKTDARPFYARREPVPTGEMNRNYAERIDVFHHDLSAARLERPRMGSCNRIKTIEQVIDGQVWRREERCGGTVHAVETRIDGAIRVDGKCLSCGWEVHRAGFLGKG